MTGHSAFQGLGQFSPAYRIMMENDAHAPGSVDRVLVEQMVRLCPETARYLYEEYTPLDLRYVRGSRPELEAYVAAAASGRTQEEIVEGIARFTARLSKKVETESLDEMRVGGMEEEIVRRGSDWCTDVARVACVLCQVAGLPARIVCLCDTEQAYSGHVMIEAHRDGRWGAVDSSTAVIYRYPNGTPASTWDLMGNPSLVESHSRGRSTLYTQPGQFRHAALVNYFVWEWKRHNYAVTPVNDYYRAILSMSLRGWPGGLRWLHGEDSPPKAARP